jgi:uncharacterized membrane-anchored protein
VIGGEYVIIKQNQYMRVFRKAGATNPGQARTLSSFGLRESRIFLRMVEKGVFVNAGSDAYYINRDAAEDFVAARRKRALTALVLVLLGLLLLWALGGRLFR